MGLAISHFLQYLSGIKVKFIEITNEGKTAKNEWENDDSNLLPGSYIVYKKLGQFFFHTLLINLLKQRYISFVTIHKYLNKLISEV